MKNILRINSSCPWRYQRPKQVFYTINLKPLPSCIQVLSYAYLIRPSRVMVPSKNADTDTLPTPASLSSPTFIEHSQIDF